MCSISPVAFLPDTPTLGAAIARVERQFILDEYTVEGSQPIGYGQFRVDTNAGPFIYEWSHVNGTQLVS